MPGKQQHLATKLPPSPPSSLSCFVFGSRRRTMNKSISADYPARGGETPDSHTLHGVHGDKGAGQLRLPAEGNSHQPLGLPHCFCSVFQKVFRGGESVWRKAGPCLLADISMRASPSPNSMSGISPCKGKAIRQGTIRGSWLFCPAQPAFSHWKKAAFPLGRLHVWKKIPPLVCSHLYPPIVHGAEAKTDFLLQWISASSTYKDSDLWWLVNEEIFRHRVIHSVPFTKQFKSFHLNYNRSPEMPCLHWYSRFLSYKSLGSVVHSGDTDLSIQRTKQMSQRLSELPKATWNPAWKPENQIPLGTLPALQFSQREPAVISFKPKLRVTWPATSR